MNLVILGKKGLEGKYSKNWSHTDHFLCVFFYVYFELDTYYKVFSLLCNPKKKFCVNKVYNHTSLCCECDRRGLSTVWWCTKWQKSQKKKISNYYWGFFRIGTIHMCLWIWCDIFFALINRQHTNQFFWLSKIQYLLYVQKYDKEIRTWKPQYIIDRYFILHILILYEIVLVL